LASLSASKDHLHVKLEDGDLTQDAELRVMGLAGESLSLPLSQALSNMMGQVIMEANLSYTFAISSVWMWLAFVVLLSALTSYVPARNASRVTVRDVWAYE
jgi:putative ABC transport system permease protein